MNNWLSTDDVCDQLNIIYDDLIELILNRKLTAYLAGKGFEKLAIPKSTDIKWSKECLAAKAIRMRGVPRAFSKPGENPDDGCAKEKCYYYNFKKEKIDGCIDGCIELFLGGEFFDKSEYFHSPDYSFRVDSVFVNENVHSAVRRWALMDLLLGLRFQKTEVDASEDPATHHAPMKTIEPAPDQKESNTIDQTSLAAADDFVSNLMVTYSSSSSVVLRPKGKSSKEFSCEDMGFKPTSKTWEMFIEILKSSDRKYCIVRYDTNKNQINNKKYNALVKRPENFSKKFVSFLNKNKEYSISLPENFNFFKNMKGNEPAGTYRPKFQIVDTGKMSKANNNTIIHDADIKKMSKDEIINEMTKLSDLLKREMNEQKQNALRNEISPYAQYALTKQWITMEALGKLIPPIDEDADGYDAMAMTDFHKNVKIESSE
jgi:hypothetical protein